MLIRALPLLLLLFMLSAKGYPEEPPPSISQFKPLIKLYFLPFHIRTEVLIRKQDIEKHNNQILWLFSEQEFSAKLRQTLEARPSDEKINEVGIRLKVEFLRTGTTFYVDTKGRVEKDGRSYFKLLPQDLEEIEKDIKQYAGVVDVKFCRTVVCQAE